MNISLTTPAPKGSRGGNRTTAARWAAIFRSLGHRVRVSTEYGDEPAGLMVALHAWRSAGSIERFRARWPERPLIVALTGTDIYRFIETDPERTMGSLARADALVGLHELVHRAIPQRYHSKLTVIFQSAPPIRPMPPLRRSFDILVIGHLREEKDPLRAALAARQLPASSRVRIIHLGRAYDAEWAARAGAEMTQNPRYQWRGDVPSWAVRRALARARLMVLSSIAEGGANAISEAVMSCVPVIASDIPGSVGLLGADYPGYYPAGDTGGLARQMCRAEQDPGFLQQLRHHCALRAALFDPQRERAAWQRLLERVTAGHPSAEPAQGAGSELT